MARAWLTGNLVAVAILATLVSLPVSPARADNCSGDARPCSRQCLRLGHLYDHRWHAVERTYRQLNRNSKRLKAALDATPVNQVLVRKLKRRDARLRKLYNRRHSKLMRTYRKLLARC